MTGRKYTAMSEWRGRFSPGAIDRRVRRGAVVVSGMAVAVCLASCGSSSSPSSGPVRHHGSSAVDIVVTGARCTTSPSSAPPGVVNFTVTSKNASSVKEVELRQADGYLLAEQPNLAAGLLGGITANLSDGSYQIYCPGAGQTTSTFTVSGAASAQTWKRNPRLVAAVSQYRDWVRQRLHLLAGDTAAFAAAVDAGNLTQAEALYAPAREDFESIEPESEAYGSLYPDIDGQIENFGNPSQFRGFHEIEESLWVGDSLAGQSKDASELVAAVQQLQAVASKATYQPVQVADYLVGQLEEASNFVATGSEERYSNVDLVDLKGTLESASEGASVLAPALSAMSPKVLSDLTAAMVTAQTALAALAQTPGAYGTGYVSYSEVNPAQRQQLAEDLLEVVVPLTKATQLVA
jgi:iron uptake system component EfeO